MDRKSVASFLFIFLPFLSLGAYESSTVSFVSIEDAIQRALENDPKILRKKLEIANASRDEMKNQGKYSWRVLAGAKIDQKRLPFNQQNIFTGTKTQTNTYEAGVERLFSTGTYFKVSSTATRFDSNAFEDPIRTPAGFGALGIPPLFTSSISITIAQDLLKNAFGYNERKREKILENNTEILREELEQELANLIVASLVDYWDYSLKEETVQTFQRLLDSTREILNLTIRKQAIGLSESFEVNQWNALLAQAESSLQNAIVEREEAKRKLLRTLQLPENTELTGTTPLVEELPSPLNYEKDLLYAYTHRADYRNLIRKKENAELAKKIALNEALPTLKASGSYGYQAQNLESFQRGFTDTKNGVPSQRFPIQQGAIDFSYPINDVGVKAGIRDAEILMRQTNLESEDLTRSIADEIRTRIDILKTSYDIFQNAKTTEIESSRYYKGVLRSFRQGRFNAITVKNALDAYVKDELNLTRTKVDYNINLHRYYIAKNSLFEVYKIDKDKLVPRDL